MKDKKNKSVSRWPDVILIIFMTLLPLVLMKYFNVTAVFYNNDDLYISEIVSGVMTGRPEGQLLHISYLTGMLISRLYMVFPQVPWYGIFLFGMMYTAIVTAFAYMLVRIDKIYIKIVAAVVADFIVCSFFMCHLTEIQYTMVTIVTGMTALVAFILAKDEENVKKYLKANWLSFLFFFFAYSIRDKACFMLLPIFFFIGMDKIIKNKALLRPVAAYAAGLVLIILVLFGIERLAYLPERWSEFEVYNTAREEIMDYTGFPVYDDYVEIYQEMGISEKSQASLPRYQLLLDENVNADFMAEVSQIAVDSREFNLWTSFKYFIELHTTSYIDRPINIIVYFMYAAVMLMALVARKYKVLYDVCALFLGRMVIWSYLLYIGRVMTRITQGVYMLELMVLFAIVVANVLWKCDAPKKNLKMVITGTCVILGIVAICCRWGLPYSRNIFYYNQSQMSYATCYKEIREYCDANPDKLFLADTYSFSYFTDDIFAKPETSASNFVMLGSWTANSPWTDTIAERYGIESYEEAAIYRDDVYFICMDSDLTPWQYLVDYYAEKYPGSVTEVVEVLETDFGRGFFIIEVRKP